MISYEIKYNFNLFLLRRDLHVLPKYILPSDYIPKIKKIKNQPFSLVILETIYLLTQFTLFTDWFSGVWRLEIQKMFNFKEIWNSQLSPYSANLVGFSQGKYTSNWPSMIEVTVDHCPKMKNFCLGSLSTRTDVKMRIFKESSRTVAKKPDRSGFYIPNRFAIVFFLYSSIILYCSLWKKLMWNLQIVVCESKFCRFGYCPISSCAWVILGAV